MAATMAETRTLSDDIYDALGMPGTWWMGRARLAEHIAIRLGNENYKKQPFVLQSILDLKAEVLEKGEEIEALKRNIDELQAELATAETYVPKKRKSKAAKKK